IREKGSPGFCNALPKQSSEFDSSTPPAFTCATGSAGPNVAFTFSIVPLNRTTSPPAPCAHTPHGLHTATLVQKASVSSRRSTAITPKTPPPPPFAVNQEQKLSRDSPARPSSLTAYGFRSSSFRLLITDYR